MPKILCTPSKLAKEDHTPEMKALPLSEVISSGRPNRAIQECPRAEAQDAAILFTVGIVSSHSVDRSIISNGIPNFEAFLLKSIYSFTIRLSYYSNKLICAIEQYWIMKSFLWNTLEEKMYI